MALFRVEFQVIQSYTGYLEGTDTDDVISKVRWPVTLNADGEKLSSHAPAKGENWDVKSVQNLTKFVTIKNLDTGADVDLSTVNTEPEAPAIYYAENKASE